MWDEAAGFCDVNGKSMQWQGCVGPCGKDSCCSRSALYQLRTCHAAAAFTSAVVGKSVAGAGLHCPTRERMVQRLDGVMPCGRALHCLGLCLPYGSRLHRSRIAFCHAVKGNAPAAFRCSIRESCMQRWDRVAQSGNV